MRVGFPGEVQRFPLDQAAAELLHPRLRNVEPRIRCEKHLAVAWNIRGLCVRPVVIHLRQRRNTLKRGELLLLSAGLRCKAVEQRLVQIQDLGGFRQRENIQPAIRQPPLLDKGRDIPGELLLRKIAVQIGQPTGLLKLDGDLWIGCADVGHRGCARIAGGDHVQAFIELRARRDGRNVDYDPLLPAERAVEFVDQGVHGLLHVAAIVVPHRQGDRILRGGTSRMPASGKQGGDHAETRRPCQALSFHNSTSKFTE